MLMTPSMTPIAAGSARLPMRISTSLMPKTGGASSPLRLYDMRRHCEWTALCSSPLPIETLAAANPNPTPQSPRALKPTSRRLRRQRQFCALTAYADSRRLCALTNAYIGGRYAPIRASPPTTYVAENPSVPVVICPRSASAAIIPSTLDMLREYGSSRRISASCRCPHGNATSASPTFSISP